MKKHKFIWTVVLTQTWLLSLGLINVANGQEHSIIRAIPEVPSYRVASRTIAQEPIVDAPRQGMPLLIKPIRPDEQESPSDSRIQLQENDLKTQQNLDSTSLTEQLNSQKISRLFEMGQWPRKGIRAISLDIREQSEKAPEDIASDLLHSQSGRWNSFAPTPKVFSWAAPNIRYQPLYFEDVPLERYGQSKSPYLQSAYSAAHFFTSLALLPYQMRNDSPASCDYPLGFCRPGNNAPCTSQRLFYGLSR